MHAFISPQEENVRLISRCVLIGIYNVYTALIERVLQTGSECALICEYALMHDMRLITQKYGNGQSNRDIQGLRNGRGALHDYRLMSRGGMKSLYCIWLRVWEHTHQEISFLILGALA